MEKEISYIKLGLMDLTSIDIKFEDIVSISLRDITENHCFWEGSNKLDIAKYCKQFTLILNSDADRKLEDGTDMTVFERLTKYMDVIRITYFDEDDEIIDEVWFSWNDKYLDGEENTYQTTRFKKDGSLVIKVEETDDETITN